MGGGWRNSVGSLTLSSVASPADSRTRKCICEVFLRRLLPYKQALCRCQGKPVFCTKGRWLHSPPVVTVFGELRCRSEAGTLGHLQALSFPKGPRKIE
jgi:hypothetical protein